MLNCSSTLSQKRLGADRQRQLITPNDVPEVRSAVVTTLYAYETCLFNYIKL